MDHVKNLLSQTSRYSWSRMAGRHITKEHGTLTSTADVIVGSAVSLYLGILLLGCCHVGVVHTYLHIVNGEPGQRVSNEVVLPLQMSDGYCVLKDVGELVLLTI